VYKVVGEIELKHLYFIYHIGLYHLYMADLCLNGKVSNLLKMWNNC